MTPQAVAGDSPTTAVEQAFVERTPRSRQLAQRAADIFPGGVSGDAKRLQPYPPFISSLEGDTAVDVDGNRYVDVLMGAGPMLLGHGHPRVVEAIRDQAGRMTNPMMPIEASYEYGLRLRGHMPYLERLRFVNTGSEATRTAIRIARSTTGRSVIAKAEGGFHGSDDTFLVSTMSHLTKGGDRRPLPVLDFAGVPERVIQEVVLIPYNDPDAARDVISEHGPRLAAVIMEPVAFASGGGVPATPEFARAVRDATASAGALLIFDEVLCACRLGLPGAPGYLGVVPDLAAIGKVIGGGLPLAAVGGRADLMEATLGHDAGERRIFQSGTFTENPLSIAAGMAALDVLEDEPILATADRTGELIRTGLRDLFEARGVTAAVTGCRSILHVHFGAESVTNRREVLRADLAMTRAFLLGMLGEGVLWPPIHPAVTSGAHSDESAGAVVSAAERVLDRLT
jgi:glutamate-1-semialdehyde 2,1-aminomutase